MLTEKKKEKMQLCASVAVPRPSRLFLQQLATLILLWSAGRRKVEPLTVFSRKKKCEKKYLFLLIHSYLSIYIYLCIYRRLYKPKVHNVKSSVVVVVDG